MLALRLKLVAGPVICHGVKPYRELNSADLPALERPTMVMRPDLMTIGDLLPWTENKIIAAGHQTGAKPTLMVTCQ
jgi:hypothetical protein